ncbi:MAG: type II toxin-antitoxin system VapC family toxin [Dehalococcoidia bacterium]
MVDNDDANHEAARGILTQLLSRNEPLLTHSYVLNEAFALVQRRLGMTAVRVLQEEFVPLLEMVWVDANLHQTAMTALLASGQRQVSLVDQVSFEVMRSRGIDTAFAFDDDFARAGFRLVE